MVTVHLSPASIGEMSSVNSNPYKGKDASSLNVSLEPKPHGLTPLASNSDMKSSVSSVSYTHLTLPTNDQV